MDATATPTWGLELRPKINTRPASFVEYFPTAASAPSPTATDEANAAGTMPQNESWAQLLAARPSLRRQPAWHRVPTQGHSHDATRTIMKRIGMPTDSAVSLKKTKAKIEDLNPVPELYQADGTPHSRVRRLSSYTPEDKEARFEDTPPSPAGAVDPMAQARVDVANVCMAVGYVHMASDGQHTKYGDRIRSKLGKRTLWDALGLGRYRGPCGNQFIRLFPLQIVSVLEKALHDGLMQDNATTAVFADMAASLRRLRDDPNRRWAAAGIPDLCAPNDATEPPSSIAMEPPTPRTNPDSPTKKLAKSATPIKSPAGRITDGMVKLQPHTTPSITGSPTKSPSAASSPLLSAAKLATSPLTRKSPTHSTPSPYLSLQRSPEQELGTSSGDLGVFPSPHGSATPSSAGRSVQQSPGRSPVKYMRPVAPTPSRWYRAEENTPREAFTPTGVTPGRYEASPSRLVPMVPGTPQQPSSIIDFKTPTGYNFGVTSSAFVSSPWLDSPQRGDDARQISTNKARRRQSEPLTRTLLKAKGRRRTGSPQKLQQIAEMPRKSLPAGPSLSPQKHKRATGNSRVRRSANETLTGDIFADDSLAGSPRPYFEDNNDTIVSDPTLAMAKQMFPGSYHSLEPQPTPRDVYNIDVRRNPDIFGRQEPARPVRGPSRSMAAVSQLANMAEDRCNGNAKVMVSQENGKLIVRFKLPERYVDLFPESQGSDESHFGTSLLSVSKSPRIGFKGHRLSSVEAQEKAGHVAEAIHVDDDQDDTLPSFPNFEAPDHTPTHLAQFSPERPLDLTQELAPPQTNQFAASSSPAYRDDTLVVSGFANSPAAYQSPVKRRASTLASVKEDVSTEAASAPSEASLSLTELSHTPSLPSSASVLELDDQERHSKESPSASTASMEGEQDEELDDGATTQPLLVAPPSTSKTQSPANLSAPTDGRSPLFTMGTPNPAAALQSFEQRNHTPLINGSMSSDWLSPDFGMKAASASKATPTSGTANLGPAIEFTPTAPSSGLKMSAQPESNGDATPTLVTSFTPVNQNATATVTPASNRPNKAPGQTAPTAAVQPLAANHDDDSPGRDYMRDFIKRSKPKRPSTTETGSPIAPPTKRLPLGAKSPNTESPHKAKGKRMLEADEKDAKSPIKATEERAPKKARRTGKGSKQQGASKPEEETATGVTREAATKAADIADLAEDDDELGDGSTARRSSRIRGQHQPASAPKSAIPTAIKLGRAGAGRGAPGSTRSAQQDLTTQTRSNTRKNRGNAEYPAQVLQKLPKAVQEEILAQESAQAKKSPESDSGQDSSSQGSDIARKRVGWSNPLESHQEEKKKVKVMAKPKASRTSGIAKPVKTMPAKQRAAKVAENLGMAGNGTPAKPQRMTRSRARGTT